MTVLNKAKSDAEPVFASIVAGAFAGTDVKTLALSGASTGTVACAGEGPSAAGATAGEAAKKEEKKEESEDESDGMAGGINLFGDDSDE